MARAKARASSKRGKRRAQSTSKKRSPAVPSTDWLSSLFENTLDGIVLSDIRDRHFSKANPSFCRMLGYTLEEVLRLSVKDIHPPEMLKNLISKFEMGVTGERRLAKDVPVLRKDGSVFYADIDGTVVTFEGRPHLLGIFRDIADRRRSEESLRKTENTFAQLYENLRDAFTSVSMDGRFLEYNSAFRDMLGYSGAELLKLTYVDLTPPRWHDVEARIVQEQVIPRGYSDVYEKEYRRKDGTVFPVELRTFLVRDPAGQPESMWAIVRDVSARKRSIEALRASEDRYRAATELLSDYIFRVKVQPDGQAVMESVSENFERITGRRLADMTQPGEWMKTIHPEDRPRIGQVLQKLIREGGEDHSEFRSFVMRHGQEVPRWIEVSSKAESDPATGRCVAVVGAVRNVTDRKVAELQQRQAVEALRESEARFRKIVEQSPMSMAIVGMDGTIEFINRKAIETFGYGPEDIPNMDRWWAQAYPDETYRNEVLATWTGHVERALAENREIQGAEYRVTCKDGTVKTVFIFGVPVADKVFVMFDDITERKRAEDELRQRTGELAALNMLSREVSASLSLDEVSASALREMLRAVRTDLAFLFMREGDRLVLHGVEPESIRQRLGRIPEHRVGECMCGLAVKLGHPVYSRDIFTDKRCTWDECKKAGFRSFAALPLRSGQEIIGVIGLSSLTERDYESQSRFLETLASAVSVSLQNAQLFAVTKQAAQTIEDERQFSDSIIEGLPGVFYLFDENGRFLRWNRNFETVNGFSGEELARLHPTDLFTGSEREYIARKVTKVFSEGSANAEAELVSKDGQRTPFFFTGMRIVFDGRPCLIGVGLDITERRRAEEALRVSEERYRQIFEINPDAMFLIDEGGLFLDANRAAVERYGYALEELRRMGPQDIAGEGLRDEARERVHKASLEPTRFEWRHASKTGKEFWVEIQTQPTDIGGKRCQFSNVRDITERKRAEEALEQNERLLRALSENLADGMVYQIDSGVDGRKRTLTYLSPAVERMHGLKVDDVKRDPALLYGQVIEEDRGLLAEREAHAFANRMVMDIDVRVRVASGEVRWRHFRSTPRVRPDGSMVWDGFEFDITERKQMEERLRQSEKLTAIGQLAGGIAHDFNNQLAGVMGYADLLTLRLEEGPLKRYAQGIAVSARRAADLTQQLLAYGRKGKYLSVPVDIHRLLAEVVAILERSIDKRIRISQVLRASHPVILGDPTQIQNALLNLALNARDAMAQGGELTFETDTIRLDEEHCRANPFGITPGDYLRIGVTDTGSGMADEVKRHLFEPFFTTKKVGEGTGMGLAGVYGTVRNHHGAIHIQSEVGRGTTIRIDLPLAPGMIKADEPETSVAPVRGTANILLVDDERTVREMATDVLCDLGYSVATCADGQEAVEYYKEHWRKLDLVILDMVMPRLGGHETFVAMQKINPRIRALLSSGYSLNGDAQTILDEGVLGFVGKPYQRTDLAQKISEALSADL